jgi:hypothetical protein
LAATAQLIGQAFDGRGARTLLDVDLQEDPMMDAVASEPVGPDSPRTGFKDRYTGLCVFGIFEIIGGAIAALLIPATMVFMLSPKIPRPAGAEASRLAIASMCALYAVAAVTLIVFGIGAMRAYRWAWALNLILAWFAVIVSLALGIPTLGYVLATAKSSGAGVAAAFVFVLVVSVPSLFLLFYREKDVELTCKHRDPVERWTDRRPLPVLAATLLAVWSACTSALSLTWTSIPSERHLLTGWPGTALLLTLVAANTYGAVAMFRVHISGWWVAMAAEAAQAVRTFLQVATGGGTATTTSAGVAQTGQAWEPISGWLMAVMFTGANVAFLLWVRRYFRRLGTPPPRTPSNMPLQQSGSPP